MHTFGSPALVRCPSNVSWHIYFEKLQLVSLDHYLNPMEKPYIVEQVSATTYTDIRA